MQYRFTTYLDETINQNEQFPFTDNYIDCPLAKLECRITIVSKGQLGRMLTFYVSCCNLADLEFYVNKNAGLMGWVVAETGAISRNLAAPINDEELKISITTYPAYNLINQLIIDLNAQIKRSAEDDWPLSELINKKIREAAGPTQEKKKKVNGIE